MHFTSIIGSILAIIALATSTPTPTPSQNPLQPRDVNPDATYHCCNATGPWPWTWGAAIKEDLMDVLGERLNNYGKPGSEAYILPAGPGKCKNFYQTPKEFVGKWGGGSEWWICNDATTELKIPGPDEIDILAAFQTLLTICKVNERNGICGQAFSQTSGYPYNLIINGTVPFTRGPG